jgi:hypothetical protein
MTDEGEKPAVFKATYSDFRTIKGRKVVQIVLEVPVEAGNNALDVLGGVPRPDQEVWVAVARLVTTEKKAMESKTDKKVNFTTQSAMCGNDPDFHQFLEETKRGAIMQHVEAGGAEPEDYPGWIRIICKVDSRGEFNRNPDGEGCARWRDLFEEFATWKLMRGRDAA